MPEIDASQISPAAVKRALAKKDLHEFIKQCWSSIEPGRTFHDNWHIQAICEHLTAVLNNDITQCEPSEILDTDVVSNIVGGEFIYSTL